MLDVLQGTLDFLILRTLAWGPQHGFGIAKWIKTVTDGRLQIEDGALYPALHRMAQKKWVAAEWGVTDSGRRARYYELTTLGRETLRTQTAAWADYVSAVQQIISASTRREARSRG